MINTTGVRSKNIFDPKAVAPFKISRSKIELFIECPRCFYIDRRLGIGRPPGFPFTLNNAVDTLLKKEFDINRAKGNAHPLMEKYGIDAIPFAHDQLEKWRMNFTGIQYHHKPTNFLMTGAIDDVWVDKEGNLMIVDYKATSTESEISMDSEYRQGYKRQMEIYQWLFRQNGFKVSDVGYFVYANGLTDRKAFDAKLEFDVRIFKHVGNDKWVEGKIVEAKECLMGDAIPESTPNCEYCPYAKAREAKI